MAESFTLAEPLHARDSSRSNAKLKVLVTGAAGNIGRYFALHSEGRYDLRLLCHDKEDTAQLKDKGEIVIADVTKLDDCKKACEGMDVVLHLAANPSPEGTWDSILPLNIGGTYNIFAAAKDKGVRRVIYASSIHAISGYPRGHQVHTTEPVNPGDLYGVSKCFGEALGRYMAEREGVQCIAVRIGAFQPLKTARDRKSIGLIDAYVSKRDLNQLLQKAVEAEHLQWAVVQALSDNAFNRMDISDARELLNYQPQDDLSEMNPALEKLHLHDSLADHHMTDESKSGMREDV